MKRARECCADHGGTPEARLIQRQDDRRPFAAQSRRRECRRPSEAGASEVDAQVASSAGPEPGFEVAADET
jgi:hypothetical protein